MNRIVLKSIAHDLMKYFISLFPQKVKLWLYALCQKKNALPQPGAAVKVCSTILFAGHDFKFAKHLIDYFNNHDDFRVIIDQWKGHVKHSFIKSKYLIRKADIIFCEWCLGNAVWYAKSKLPHQKLIVRLHSQELRKSYIDEINWEKVDFLVAICPRNFAILKNRFPVLANRVAMIHNMIDFNGLQREKGNGAEFNLGMVGVTPRLKNPLTAVSILEKLRKYDVRYKLYLKEKNPMSFDWIRNRPEEVKYYKQFMSAVDNSFYRKSIFFDAWGDDMAEWYSRIGFILSASDREGSHHSIAEGMAAGCIPVIRDWPGARELYSSDWIFKTEEEAIAMVIKYASSKELFMQASIKARREAFEKFNHHDILKQYQIIIDKLLASKKVI